MWSFAKNHKIHTLRLSCANHLSAQGHNLCAAHRWLSWSPERLECDRSDRSPGKYLSLPPPGTPRCPSSNRPRKKLFLPVANAQKWTVTRMLLGERNGKHVSLALRKRRYLNVQRHFTEIQEQPAPGTREDPWAQLQVTRRVLESCFSTQ